MHKEGKLGWTKRGAIGWPVFVVWNNGKGRVVVDIRGLNANTMMDAYPMPRQEDIMQGISGKYWLSIFDLSAAFLQRLVALQDRWILTVVSHRGLETFNVAPMGFKNSPAHMQRFMDRILWHLRRFIRCYIDDIIVASVNWRSHMGHLRALFEVLRRANLYLSASKCHIAYHSIELLGRKVDRYGLSTPEKKIEAIRKLAFPRTLASLEMFIGTCNYHRNHIPGYAAEVEPLERLKSVLLKESPAKEGKKRKMYTATTRLDKVEKQTLERARMCFERMKALLSGPNTLMHFDPEMPSVVRIDTSKQRGYGVSVNQVPAHVARERQWTVRDLMVNEYDAKAEMPVCFLSKRLNKHEMNYWPTELEVAGLVWTVRKIRHLIEDASKVIVYTDHRATVDIAKQTNFKNSTPHRQNLRLVRASLFLSQFDLDIRYIPGKQNIVPDALSRLSTEDEGANTEVSEDADIYDILHMEPLVTMVHVSDNMVDKLQTAYMEDEYLRTKFAELKRRFAKAGTLPVIYNGLMLEDATVDGAYLRTEDASVKPTTVGSRALDSYKFLIYLVEGQQIRLCIPRKLQKTFLELAHDRHNHGGIDRTYHRLRQHYWMKSMAKVVKDYVQHCPSCLTNKPPKFVPSGKLQPIKAPSVPWELVTMDFVVKLPPSTPKGHIWNRIAGKGGSKESQYDSLLTITDKLTKHVRLVLGREDWSAKEWAEAYFEAIYPTLGVPGAIITDRGSVFLSYFWTTLFGLMKTDCIATTAYNPQADGQSERTNQTVEIALRHLVNTKQDDWAQYIGEIQLVQNNSVNKATGMTPNEAMLGFLPRAALDLPTSHIKANSQKVRDLLRMKSDLVTIRQEVKDALTMAEFTMAEQYDRAHKAMDLQIGDHVYINFATKNKDGYTTSGIISRKLGPQRAGPYKILDMAGPNACLVDLPADWKIWPVISIRNLTKAPATPDIYGRTVQKHAEVFPVEPEKEAELVLDSRREKGKIEYFVKWKSLPLSRCSWIPEDQMENVRNLVEEFNTAKREKSLGKRKRTRVEQEDGDSEPKKMRKG
jgi:hypothetical protein